MKVKLNVPRVGPAGSFGIGDEIDVDDAEATRMIERGQADPVRSNTRQFATPKAKREKAVKNV